MQYHFKQQHSNREKSYCTYPLNNLHNFEELKMSLLFYDNYWEMISYSIYTFQKKKRCFTILSLILIGIDKMKNKIVLEDKHYV